jgi:hypothetical protein
MMPRWRIQFWGSAGRVKRARFKKHSQRIPDISAYIQQHGLDQPKKYKCWRDAMLALFEMPDRDDYEVTMVADKHFELTRVEQDG